MQEIKHGDRGSSLHISRRQQTKVNNKLHRKAIIKLDVLFFSRIWNQLYGAGERVLSVIARSGEATQHKTLLCQPLIDYSCIQ